MKHPSTLIMLLLSFLVLITLALFVATILLDPTRDNSLHIALYFFAALALLVGIGNSYLGYGHLLDARRNGQPLPWYKHYRLTYGMLILLSLLGLFYSFGLSSKLPHEIHDPLTLSLLVVLGLLYLPLLILTTRNKYRA